MSKSSIIQTQEYQIHLTSNAGESLDKFLEKHSYSRLFILMDENTYMHCYPVLSAGSQMLSEADLLVIDPGEENKSIEIAAHLWESLTDGEADRHSLLINLGGGLVSDLGGFVASTFKRGLDFINIPTSLLAMVDASIGGKTGINFGSYKNQIGVFAAPKILLIDYRFLETLDESQVLSAYAEMVKHSLISKTTHWEELSRLNSINAKSLIPFIEESIKIKKQIVDLDPKEKGLRKMLNFGHTIGHALESFYLKTEKPLLHGEAVALGMMAEIYLSAQILKFPQKEQIEIESRFQKHYSHLFIDKRFTDDITKLVFQDKKKDGNNLNVSLLRRIGHCEINVQLSKNQIAESINYLSHGFFNSKG